MRHLAHAGVDGSLGEGDVVDGEVDREPPVPRRRGEERVHVAEHGRVAPARLDHDVEPAAPRGADEERADELGGGAVAGEDGVLERGVARRVLERVERAEVLVGDGGDDVVQLAEEAVAERKACGEHRADSSIG